MADGFVSKVAELERALERVERGLRGAELERTRGLVAALMDVHRVALLDLERVLGKAVLGEMARREPSLAWLLACHEIESQALEESVSDAERAAEAQAAAAEKSAGFVPVAQLLRKHEEPAT